jgi:LytS/YehU family sensor histidine kinase
LSFAFAAAWTGLVVLSIALLAPPGVLQAYLRAAVAWQVVSGLFIYGIVAGVAHAWSVTRRLRREHEAAARAEALRARAELNALRAQMNPHFLFNTLHSISALVRSDPHAVEHALERLGALLRRLLDVNRAGADQIALAEEWDIVRDQLELETLRFGDRLRIDEQIEPDALECLLPVFTLQPLVENAIRHAVAMRTQTCVVRIRAAVHDEQLILEVTDDGPGADPRVVHAAPGLGLSAVRQRLLALYGDRAGVRIAAAPGRGFSVRVTMPAIANTVELASAATRAKAGVA